MKKKVISLTLVICMILSIGLACAEETYASGYDFTLTGLVLYFSKEEATAVADNLDNGMSLATCLAPFAGYGSKAFVVITGVAMALTKWKISEITKQLRSCSKRGATIWIPYYPPGPLGVALVEAKSR